MLMEQFLTRHGRAPIKAVLLLQSGFPGIGNWMADEILGNRKSIPAAPPQVGFRRNQKVARQIQSVSVFCLPLLLAFNPSNNHLANFLVIIDSYKQSPQKD